MPCGHCSECLKSKRDALAFRLDAEFNDPSTLYACFVTLTYNDEHLPETFNDETGEVLQSLDSDDIKRFHKYLRKYSGVSFKFAVFGEYGDKFGRPHYHGIYFVKSDKRFADFREDIKKCWVNGFADVQLPRNGFRAFNYVTKYVIKGVAASVKHGYRKPFMRLSKGIGLAVVERHRFDPGKPLFFENSEGRRIILPRYYHTHIFDRYSLQYHQMLTRFYMTDRFNLKLQQLGVLASGYEHQVEYTSKSDRSIQNLRNFGSIDSDIFDIDLKYY